MGILHRSTLLRAIAKSAAERSIKCVRFNFHDGRKSLNLSVRSTNGSVLNYPRRILAQSHHKPCVCFTYTCASTFYDGSLSPTCIRQTTFERRRKKEREPTEKNAAFSVMCVTHLIQLSVL